MLINVFNKKTTSIETIDTQDVIAGVHVHRNTHEELVVEKKVNKKSK